MNIIAFIIVLAAAYVVAAFFYGRLIKPLYQMTKKISEKNKKEASLPNGTLAEKLAFAANEQKTLAATSAAETLRQQEEKAKADAFHAAVAESKVLRNCEQRVAKYRARLVEDIRATALNAVKGNADIHEVDITNLLTKCLKGEAPYKGDVVNLGNSQSKAFGCAANLLNETFKKEGCTVLNTYKGSTPVIVLRW